MDAESYLKDVLKTGRWCPTCDATRIDGVETCPNCGGELWTRYQLWERLKLFDSGWRSVCKELELDPAATTPGVLLDRIRRPPDRSQEDVEIWRQRAEALRSALRLDTLHWDGAAHRAREMFSFLGQGRKDLLLDDGESDSDFVVQLPPCPQCGGSTEFKVCSNFVDCVDRSGCGWRGVLEVVGHQAAPLPPIVHELKTWPVPFQDTKAGNMTMELRRDDREPRFAPGHRLRLREYDPEAMDVVGDKGAYTDDELLVEVTAVYREESAIPEGYALLAVQPVDDDPAT